MVLRMIEVVSLQRSWHVPVDGACRSHVQNVCTVAQSYLSENVNTMYVGTSCTTSYDGDGWRQGSDLGPHDEMHTRSRW